MDAKPDVVADEVRARRESLDTRLDALEERVREADPRRLQKRLQGVQGRRVGMWTLPVLAGAGVWAWRRYSGGIHELNDLLVRDLAELSGAEDAILEALPRMVEAANSPELRIALEHHLQETRGHVERLERVWRMLGRKPRTRRSRGIEGIIDEGRRLMRTRMDDDARDAALIAAAQKVEHYEIAAYGTVRTYAQTLRRSDAAALLQQTLDEEHAADQKLTKLATSFVNPEAVH